MIKDRKLKKNFIWNTVGSTLNAFNSLFILVTITRINGLNSAGSFSIAFATASILYVLAIYSGRNCHITDIKGETTDKEYIIARIITCFFTIVIMIGYALLKTYYNSNIYILISLCIWKILEAISDVFYAILQKNEELYKAGISLTLKSIICVGCFILIDVITNNLNLAFTVLYILTFLIIALFDIPNVAKFIRNEKKEDFKNILNIYKREFWIFGNTILVMYILNAPKYIIEYYLANDIQAIFAIILMPASIIPLFSQFVMAPIINKIANLYKIKDIEAMEKIDNKITLSILGFGIFASIIGYLIGIPVLNIIYNQNLDAYKTNLIILLLAYTLYAMAYVKTIILTTFRKLKEQFYLHIISTALIIILSTILIRNFGVDGASFACLILMSIYYIMIFFITEYNYKKKEMN